MLPDIGGTELMIVAIVALIVVGPKDLPLLLRKIGTFVGKLRAMAADFRASFDDMARQSELDELRKQVEAMRKGDIEGLASLTGETNTAVNEIEQGLADVGVDLYSPTGEKYPEIEPDPEPTKPAKKPRTKAAGKPKTRSAAAKPKAAAAKPKASSAAKTKTRPKAKAATSGAKRAKTVKAKA